MKFANFMLLYLWVLDTYFILMSWVDSMTKSAKRRPGSDQGKTLLLLGDRFARNNCVLAELAHVWRENLSVCVRYFGNDAMLIDKEALVFYDLGVERTSIADSWALAQAQIISQECSLVILLDFAQALFDRCLIESKSLKRGDTEVVTSRQVVNWLLENKPPESRLIITGREADDELHEYVDEVRICSPIKESETVEHRRVLAAIEPTGLSSLSPKIVEFLLSALQNADCPTDLDLAVVVNRS